MSEDNIRRRVINLLKLSSAAFIENHTRDNYEKNAVCRSNVYLEEFRSLLTSPEHIDTVKKTQGTRETKLKATDFIQKRQCAGSFDISCKNNEVTDENVKQLVAQSKANISNTHIPSEVNFEKDFDSILNSIEKTNVKEKPSTKKNGNDNIFGGVQSAKKINDIRPSNECPGKVNNKFFGTQYKDAENRSIFGSTSTQLPNKKALTNPFKKARIDHTDIVFTQNPSTTSIKECIQKMENKKKNLEGTNRDIIDMDKEVPKNPSRPKFVNPWKEEKVIKNSNFYDLTSPKKETIKKRESPFGQFNTKQNMPKEKLFNKPQRNLFENVENQHFTKDDNTFKSHNDKEKKNDARQINNPFSSFRTGNQELEWQKNLQKRPPQRGLTKKRAVTNVDEQMPNNDIDPLRKKFNCPSFPKSGNNKTNNNEDDEDVCEELKGFDKEILKRIQREIVIDSKEVSWDDIIGLEGAKKVIKESVILAIKRPDLFSGLRQCSRAIMLFGPPGTGKTLIGKCIASSCDATFMSVSASSLTSKWIGESETLVRAMFTYAKIKQPCVIFFDEIDSLLEKRSEQGNETFNRIKTEFLVQLDGANALKETDKVLLIGATNRPDVLDEAILRRFTKRILVPLPIKEARVNMVKHLLSKHCHTITDAQIDKLADLCDKYSGSDISQVCKEAAMMSIRRLDASILEAMDVNDIPPISPKDFLKALRNVKPTVSQETIEKLEEWNLKFGSTVDTNYANDNDDTDFFGDDLDDDL